MYMILHNIASKIKTWHESEAFVDVLTLGIVILVAICSFGLGRLSVIQKTSTEGIQIILPGGSKQGIMQYSGTQKANPDQQLERPVTHPDGAYFASKNGTKYYPKGCVAGNKILPENKVFFLSVQEAVDAGYSIAKGC